MAVTETQRMKDIARAALLRERILSTLRAAPGSMSLKDICNWPSILELYHPRLLPAKVDKQLRALAKTKHVERVGYGIWRAVRATEQREAAAAVQPVQHLKLEVHKADKTVSFVFEGLQITVKVLP